jgi:hypothetical protein
LRIQVHFGSLPKAVKPNGSRVKNKKETKMSNSTLVHIKYDPSHSGLKQSAKSLASKAKSSNVKFATYVPIEGKGSAVTVILDPPARTGGAAERATKTAKGTGTKALAKGPRHGVHALHARTATITSHGKAAAAKPYALAFVVSYDPAQAEAIRGFGRALKKHNPSLRHHVIRREGVAGHAIVVVPVDDLAALDKPASAAGQTLAAPLKKALKSVSVIKLRRVAGLSA